MVHDILASCIPFPCLFKFGRNSSEKAEKTALKSETEVTLEYVYCSLCLMQHKTCPNISKSSSLTTDPLCRQCYCSTEWEFSFGSRALNSGESGVSEIWRNGNTDAVHPAEVHVFVAGGLNSPCRILMCILQRQSGNMPEEMQTGNKSMKK